VQDNLSKEVDKTCKERDNLQTEGKPLKVMDKISKEVDKTF